MAKTDIKELIMNNELVEIKKENAMTVFTQESGLDSYVKQVADEVASFSHDMKTVASRNRTKALASKVAKIKVKYDECGKDLVSGWKADAKKVDASRKKMRDELDALKILARKPVTDWEAEQAVIEQERLDKIKSDKLAAEIASCEEVGALMDEKFDRDLADLKVKVAADKLVEDARIEAERIQNNARIAEQAKVDAELAAKKLIDDANTAKQQAIDDKAQADKELLEQQARAKLLQEQAAQDKLNSEWIVYITEAYEINNKIDQDNHYKMLAEQAEVKRLADIEAARLQEVQRQANAQKQIQDEANQRAADEKHTRVINRAIYTCFTNAGLTADCAKMATQALIDSKINHVTINY